MVIRADAAQRAARQADEPAIGRLGIGYLPDALPATVPRLLRRFSALVSGDPRLARDRRGAPPARERPGEGRIDVAVTCLPAPVSGLRAVTIGEEGGVAAVPQDHPCANRAEIDLTWLERTALVQLSGAVNPAFYDGVLGACPRRRARLGPVIENAEPAVKPVLLAVDAGPGVALLPFEPGGNAVRRLADWIEDVRYHSRVPGQADVRASAARRRCSAGTRLVVELPLDPSRGS